MALLCETSASLPPITGHGIDAVIYGVIALVAVLAFFGAMSVNDFPERYDD